MRILITGSRHWGNVGAIRKAIAHHAKGSEHVTVVHGGASGADIISGHVAKKCGMSVEKHPADWDTHGKAAGPIRNKKMVDLGADVCLAFPLGESRGTRGCMRMAEAAGISVVNYGDRPLGGM